MRKSDLINQISDKTGIPKVDVLVTLETMFKEVKESLSNGQNIYIYVALAALSLKKEPPRSGAILKRILLLKFLNIISLLLNPPKNL